MNRINRNIVNKPECLENKADAWTNELIEQRKIKPDYWIWHQYKNEKVEHLISKALTEISNNRCSYCDIRPVRKGAIKPSIDHFKPKSNFPELAYEWTNLFLSCYQCQEYIYICNKILKIKKMNEILCVHCGEDCGKHPIVWNEKPFCCNGCKSVYEIIEQKNLYKYYEIANNPGIKVEKNDYKNKYAYLDDKEIQAKIFDFAEGNIRKVKFFIPAIHCSSCIWLLENLHTLNSGVIQSLVNFVKKEVTITFKNDEITLRQLVELLISIHYIPNITLESVEKDKSKKSNKKILFKIGVAGFAFGNTMLFSFPEYLPGSETIDFHYKTFFGLMNLLLAIPVFFYSGSDYLISALKSIKNKIINIDIPISLGLIAIFVESTYEILSSTGSGYMDSLTGLVFFLLIGKWYQSITYQALTFDRDYKSYFPVAVTKMVNNEEVSVQIKNLEVNDIIKIRNQELIPADAELIAGKANIDYSFVTGESLPVSKVKGEFIYAGGKQIGSTIELKIKNKVEQSRLTQIWNQSIESAKKQQNSLSFLIDKVSRNFTIIVLSISLITAIFWFFVNPNLILKSFTSVLIVACPCALALSIPFTYGNAMRIFGNKGFYLKKNEVVEKLSKIDTIVFDKTGTITQSDLHEIEFVGDKILSEQVLILIYSLSKHSTHTLSVSITNYLKNKININSEKDVLDFEEIEGEGVQGKIENNFVKIGSQKFVNANNLNNDNYDTKVYILINNKMLGYFKFQNKYRNNLEEVLNNLTKKYELHLLSGDNIKEKQRLEPFFAHNLHFNQTPNDKFEYIKNLQNAGKNVLMIGDGLNDAGALNQSNVGITIADNIYHFSPACDAILEAANFKSLPHFIDLNKKIIKIVKSSFVVSFLYNIIGLSFAVRGLLAPIVAAILMPISSITVVAYVTLLSSIAIWRKLKFDKNIQLE